MYIHWLDEMHSATSSQVGGKGAHLGRLIQSGVVVPAGFCIGVSGYQKFVTRSGLKSALTKLVAQIDADNLEQLFNDAPEISHLFLETHLPGDMQAEIMRAYRELGTRMASPNPPVAVRSSSTAEDMQLTSFAGQYDSYLNVRGEQDLTEKIKRCWASMWNPQAIHYRHTNGFDPFDCCMAIVVQQMVDSTASGVLFTANPVTGDLTEMVVNSSWGLGEGVVVGTSQADSFVMDRVSKSIRRRNVAVKRSLVDFAQGSGTRESTVAEELRHKPSLSDSQLEELHGLGLAIEDIYNTPQDIEWGHDGDQFYILQARPITGLDKFPVFWANEEDKKHTWSLPGARAKPDPMLPIDESRQRMFYMARMSGLSQIGGGRPLGNDYRVFNGYVYERAAPFDASPDELARRKQQFEEKLQKAWNKGKTAWHEYYFPYIDATNKRLKAFDIHGATNQQLAEHIRKVLDADRQYWEIHWMRGGQELEAQWHNVFTDLTGINDAVKALTASIGPNKSTETIVEITRLVELVKASPYLVSLFETPSAAELYETLQSDAQARDFKQQFERFIEAYGYKSGAGFGSHNSISLPTWKDDPGIVLSIISRYIPLEKGVFEANFHSIPPAAHEVIEEAYANIGKDEAKRQQFEAQLALARMNTADQEDHNFHLDQTILALVRLPCIEAAGRLASAGGIEERDDFKFVTLEELLASLEEISEFDLREIVRARKLLHMHRQQLHPPESLGGDCKPRETSTPTNPPMDTVSTLSGTPASVGTVTGIARIVSSDEIVPNLKPGEILVSSNAGPMWTPLFPIIGGLVLDGGNVLLHAALVAREYKIPAVLLTGNATKTIQDGQTITVDGTSGMVHLH